MAISILRTNALHPEFQRLVKLLDLEIMKKEGKQFDFYDQYNSSEHIKHVTLVFQDSLAIGCGAIKKYDSKTVEIKRMYTVSESRGIGAATLILNELEKWAKELGYHKAILETGKKYTEALALYNKHGFLPIDKYGPYEFNEDSVCLGKEL